METTEDATTSADQGSLDHRFRFTLENPPAVAGISDAFVETLQDLGASAELISAVRGTPRAKVPLGLRLGLGDLGL